MKRIRRIVIYPLLCLASCHLLMTGSPIPLWHIETLRNPQAVVAVSNDALTLKNGIRITLPFIQRIPAENAIFLDALQHGVELTAGGEVVGLLNIKKLCGNDPVAYRRIRVNLSDLSGVLYPSGIDHNVVHPDVIEFLTHRFDDIDESVRVDGLLIAKIRTVRKEFDHSLGRENEKPSDAIGKGGEHDRRSGLLLL